MLSKLGYDQNFGVSAPGENAEDQGWLYDLSWYDWDNETNQRLTRLPLVLESEWSFNSDVILYDFDKLLQARAERKVMIFQSNSDDTRIKLVQEMKQRIEVFNSKNIGIGDRYLLTSYNRPI